MWDSTGLSWSHVCVITAISVWLAYALLHLWKKSTMHHSFPSISFLSSCISSFLHWLIVLQSWFLFRRMTSICKSEQYPAELYEIGLDLCKIKTKQEFHSQNWVGYISKRSILSSPLCNNVEHFAFGHSLAEICGVNIRHMKMADRVHTSST